jgi:hypothetical protein
MIDRAAAFFQDCKSRRLELMLPATVVAEHLVDYKETQRDAVLGVLKSIFYCAF